MTRRTRDRGLRSPQGPVGTAVALEFDGAGAPRVSATGSGELARAIVAIAEAHGVPVHEDPELAGVLSRLELGDEIPRELYVAVAEVLAFAYWLSGKAVPPDPRPSREPRPSG